jgi:hypothetical protein
MITAATTATQLSRRDVSPAGVRPMYAATLTSNAIASRVAMIGADLPLGAAGLNRGSVVAVPQR